MHLTYSTIDLTMLKVWEYYFLMINRVRITASLKTDHCFFFFNFLYKEFFFFRLLHYLLPIGKFDCLKTRVSRFRELFSKYNYLLFRRNITNLQLNEKGFSQFSLSHFITYFQILRDLWFFFVILYLGNKYNLKHTKKG